MSFDKYCSMPVDDYCTVPVDTYCSMPTDNYCSMPIDNYCSMPLDTYCTMPIDTYVITYSRKFPHFTETGNRKFITAFMSAATLPSLSQINSVHAQP